MRLTDVTKRYGAKQALDRVSFELDHGCTALLGPNGAGKTTLMKCIAGLISPTRGVISRDPDAAIGYLPQDFSFLPNLTVRESLVYLGRLSGIGEDHLTTQVDLVIENTRLEEYSDVRLKALSGGTTRRLGIAQALLGPPELLLLDEPTAGLDIEERGKLKDILARTSRVHAILVSTHLAEDIVGLCDRVLVLQNGTLRFDGSPDQLISYADGRVCVSADDSPSSRGGITSGLTVAAGSSAYRYVMPERSSECTEPPTVADGYLALLHGYAGKP